MKPRPTILITGAFGFTGRHLINVALEQGYRCIAISQSDKTSIPKVETLCCDLLNKAAISAILETVQPNYIVHLAAVSFVGHGDTKDIYLNNIVGTTNLLDAIKEKCGQVTKVLVASSGNVYGNSQALPIKESEAVRPENDYGVSKCAMEYAVRIRMNELPIIIVRPFNYTGAGQSLNFLIPKIVNAYTNSESCIELGNLDVSRDFSDVRDVVAAYLKLITSPLNSETYNICSGVSTSLNEIITKLNFMAGYNINVHVNPKFVRKNEIKELYGSEEKLRSAIGNYRNFTLEDTLDWMYQT